MERDEYFEARCAILEAAMAVSQADQAKARAQQRARAILERLGITLADRYEWDEATLTITPLRGDA
jgi:hypothetical protein